MDYHELQSTVIDVVGYSRVLEIRFESGAVYQYYDVPEHIFTALLEAESKGRYFNSHIRGKYNSRRIRLHDESAADNTKSSTPRSVGK